MPNKQDQILNHIIDIKAKLGVIDEHLKTLNGTVERQQREIETRENASLINSKAIGALKETVRRNRLRDCVTIYLSNNGPIDPLRHLVFH